MSNHHVEASTATERYYHSDSHPERGYYLPSDEHERERLALQHRLLKEGFGNELLPRGLDLKAGDKLLDAGTGGGAWILDLSSTVPGGVSLIGCDIESKIFPSNPPKNTVFFAHSVDSLPADWSSTFVLVHQRLLLVPTQGIPDWKSVLTELHRVLKSGGWLQLIEVVTYPWVRGDKGPFIPDFSDFATRMPYTHRMTSILEGMFRARNKIMPNYIEQLGDLLKETQFEQIEKEELWAQYGPGDIGVGWREDFLKYFDAVKVPALKADGYGLIKAEEWDEHMNNMAAEWKANDWGYKFYKYTARKP